MSDQPVGIPYVESTLIKPGTQLIWKQPFRLIIHPLDIIAIEHPKVHERLPLAMRWITEHANKKFDRAISALTGRNP